MKACLFSFFLFVLFSQSVQAKKEQINYTADASTCTATFDSSKYKRNEIENASKVVHELASTAPLKFLNLCVAGDPMYKDCGNRDLSSPNFIFNAQANVDHNKKTLEQFEKIKVPREIEPLKAKVLEDLKFDAWNEETKLQFYIKRELKILTDSSFPKIDVKQCESTLDGLDKTFDLKGLEKIVTYSWGNCINRQWRRVAQKESETAWKKIVSNEKCETEHAE